MYYHIVIWFMIIAMPVQTFAHAIPIVDIKEVDESRYNARAKKNSTGLRVAYRDGDYFIKIWGKNYVSTARFLRAIEVGFYDTENTPLVALIYDEGICRGYITRVGVQLQELTDAQGILYQIKDQKDQRYIDFYNDLLARSRRTGLIFPDLVSRNIVLEDGKIKIIDLEWVVTPDLVPKGYFKSSSFPRDYQAFVKKMCS